MFKTKNLIPCPTAAVKQETGYIKTDVKEISCRDFDL